MCIVKKFAEVATLLFCSLPLTVCLYKLVCRFKSQPTQSSIIEYVPKFMPSRNYSETLKQIYRYSQCNVELYEDKRGHLTPLNFFKVPFVLVTVEIEFSNLTPLKLLQLHIHPTTSRN